MYRVCYPEVRLVQWDFLKHAYSCSLDSLWETSFNLLPEKEANTVCILPKEFLQPSDFNGRVFEADVLPQSVSIAFVCSCITLWTSRRHLNWVFGNTFEIQMIFNKWFSYILNTTNSVLNSILYVVSYEIKGILNLF